MASSFDQIAPVYANIMSEAKGRLIILQRTLAEPEPTDVLEYVAASDLCSLQFRKVFEAIALGCLAVHGDLPGTNRLKKDAYRADKLLAAVAKLNPDFYPRPCEILKKIPGKRAKIRNLKGDWLTRDELQRLYFKFDHEMHVGTLTRRTSIANVIQWDDLRDVLRETKLLTSTHWINLIDGTRILCDTTAERGIFVETLIKA